MDYVTQRRLGNAFANLDRALQRNDRIAADLARMDIDRLLEEGAPKEEGPSLPNGTPVWIRDLIANQGLRMPALERALDVRKVVLSPTFGKGGGGLKLEIKF